MFSILFLPHLITISKPFLLQSQHLHSCTIFLILFHGTLQQVCLLLSFQLSFYLKFYFGLRGVTFPLSPRISFFLLFLFSFSLPSHFIFITINYFFNLLSTTLFSKANSIIHLFFTYFLVYFFQFLVFIFLLLPPTFILILIKTFQPEVHIPQSQFYQILELFSFLIDPYHKFILLFLPFFFFRLLPLPSFCDLKFPFPFYYHPLLFYFFLTILSFLKQRYLQFPEQFLSNDAFFPNQLLHSPLFPIISKLKSFSYAPLLLYFLESFLHMLSLQLLLPIPFLFSFVICVQYFHIYLFLSFHISNFQILLNLAYSIPDLLISILIAIKILLSSFLLAKQLQYSALLLIILYYNLEQVCSILN